MCNYQGSKAKWFNEIWTPIYKDLTEYEGLIIDYKKMPYIELFCGGFGLGARVQFEKRTANDINPYVIAYLSRIAEETDWLNNPEFMNITKEKYDFIRNQYRLNTGVFSESFLGFVGICFSYGYQFFAGYNNDGKKSPKLLYESAKEHALEDHKLLQGVNFSNRDYRDVRIPKEPACIYCDVPYEGTKGYNGQNFDLREFIEYVRYLKSLGHYIYISEIKADMPLGIEQISQFCRPVSLGLGRRIRKVVA